MVYLDVGSFLPQTNWILSFLLVLFTLHLLHLMSELGHFIHFTKFMRHSIDPLFLGALGRAPERARSWTVPVRSRIGTAFVHQIASHLSLSGTIRSWLMIVQGWLTWQNRLRGQILLWFVLQFLLLVLGIECLYNFGNAQERLLDTVLEFDVLGIPLLRDRRYSLFKGFDTVMTAQIFEFLLD